MVVKTRQQAAAEAQAAAKPPSEVNTGSESTLSMLTELPMTPSGLRHPQAVGYHAGTPAPTVSSQASRQDPAIEADAPESVTNREAYSTGSSVTFA